MPPKTPKSQLEAAQRWDESNCKRLSVKFKNAEFDDLTAFCKQNCISRNGFVRQAVAEAIDKARKM